MRTFINSLNFYLTFEVIERHSHILKSTLKKITTGKILKIKQS